MATIFKKFSSERKAFLNPEDSTEFNPDFPQLCVSTFSESIINTFIDTHDTEVIGELYSANGSIPIYKVIYKDMQIALFLSRVGAPACVAGIEEIIAMGGKKLVLFGNCGILDEESTHGKIIVPTAAIRDEGTSYHYVEAADEIIADKKSIDVLSKCLERCGYCYVKGKTWTTDAIYRETKSLISERKAAGCIAVEMEYAAVLAVTQFRKIPFIQFLFGADNLDASQWEQRDLMDYGVSNAQRYLALAFDCVLEL